MVGPSQEFSRAPLSERRPVLSISAEIDFACGRGREESFLGSQDKVVSRRNSFDAACAGMTALTLLYPGVLDEDQRAFKDFKVKLGSIVDLETRRYYAENGFSYLAEKLQSF